MTSFLLAVLAFASAASASHHHHHDAYHRAQRDLPFAPRIGLAVDTTGSMSGFLSAMRAPLGKLLTDRQGSPNQPSSLVLSPFHDDLRAGPLTVTSNHLQFSAVFDTLAASGGLDCPELAIRGINLALESLPTGGELYVVTDASAKDAEDADQAIALARARGVKVFFFLFGSLCGVGEPAYLRIAEATGGQAHSGLTVADAALVTNLIDAVSRINHAPIVQITPSQASPIISLTTIPPATADRRAVLRPRAFVSTISFAVDASLANLVLSIDGGTSVTLTQPDGSILPAALQSTVDLTRGVVVSVATPVTGNWTLTVNDCEACSVSIFGDASISASSLQLLLNVTAGAPVAVTDPPVIGCEYLTSVQVEGNVTNPVFELRTAAGVFLSAVRPGPASTTPGTYYGAITIPDVPFLVYLRGLDAVGNEILRVVPGLVTGIVGTCPTGAAPSSTPGTGPSSTGGGASSATSVSGSASSSSGAGGSASSGSSGSTVAGSVTGSTVAGSVSGSASGSASGSSVAGSVSATGVSGGVSGSVSASGTGAGSVAATVISGSRGASATGSAGAGIGATGSLAAPASTITTHTQIVVGGPCGLICQGNQANIEAVTHVVINWTSICVSLTTIVSGTCTKVSTVQQTLTQVVTVASRIPCATCTGPNYPPPPCHGPSCAIPAIPLVPACHGPECAVPAVPVVPAAPAVPTPCAGPGCPVPLTPAITVPVVPGCSGPNCRPACSGPDCPIGTGVPGTPVAQPPGVVTAGASQERGVKDLMLGQIYAVVLAMLLW